MRDTTREWILPILFGLIAGAVLCITTDPRENPPAPKPKVDINLILKDGRVLDIEIDGKRIEVTP